MQEAVLKKVDNPLKIFERYLIHERCQSKSNCERMKSSYSLTNLRIFIVIYGMIFNGIIYGFSSPALPSLNKTELLNSTIFDRILPK